MNNLFYKIYNCSSEYSLHEVLGSFEAEWHPLGDNKNNYGTVENQQSSPIAALIEKVTNSIDATLMKKCYEVNLDPRSKNAPKTMNKAVELFFSPEKENWHLSSVRKEQAKNIQIIADGSTKHPNLIIYDNGEGQHPEAFEDTLLSLSKGNKNDIPFVQGKYNMGGTGAIVFCGENRYQLIGSRRYDGTGEFGFTLIRKHPRSAHEKEALKNTWYEYLKIDGKIPSFAMDELDLGLADRKFKTGTIIKLFNYQLPKGTRGALPQEPRRALNQFLFEPALPLYLKDTPKRYPKNKVLEGDTFGLKNRLEDEKEKYVDTHFTEELSHNEIGKLKTTCYVFKSKVGEQSVSETRKNINREYFHDNMSVLFSMNGQVHGSFTSEFITRTLKMPLLKNHLLIHIDCTELDSDFRNELFMASRDRLKAGQHTARLRSEVGELLKKSQLKEIYNQRKNSLSVGGGDAKDLLKSFSKSLPFNSDLMRLLKQSFNIDKEDDKKKASDQPKKPKKSKEPEPFDPKRYPSFFKMKGSDKEKVLTIPERDEKVIQFATDVENDYFDRNEDPGEIKVSILQHKTNEATGGDAPGELGNPSKLLNVQKSSPKDGTIRIGLGATSDLKSGDEVEISAELGGPKDLECRFWVKITDPKEKPKEVEKAAKEEEPPMGLPEYVLVYEMAPQEQPDAMTWAQLEVAAIEIKHKDVMHPLVDGDQQLEKIYINMNSSVLMNYVSSKKNIGVEQKELAHKKYISSVYFHTIFLYTITKNKGFSLTKGEESIDLDEYLKDVFSSYYSEFLLNFGTDELMDSMSD